MKCDPDYQHWQVNLVHDRPYNETVVVEEMATHETYTTRRSRHGVDVASRYSFEVTDEGATLVTLVKEMSAPLTRHLMTASGHDGNSLEYLRYTIEDEM